jgi:hypothetical protein
MTDPQPGAIEEISVDGLERITIAGGLVRIDLVTFEAGNGEPGSQSGRRRRLVMSVESFARAFPALRKSLDTLVRQGRVKVAPATRGRSSPEPPK